MILLSTYAFNWIIARHKTEKQSLLFNIEELSKLNKYNAQLNIIETTHRPLLIDSLTEILTEHGDTTTMARVANSVPKPLFFFYSKFSCNSCVDQQLKAINKRLGGKHSKEIYLLTENTKIKNINLIKRINKADKIKIFRLCDKQTIYKNDKDDSFLNPTETPFYFTIDSRSYMSNLFLPNPYDSARTVSYLNQILDQ